MWGFTYVCVLLTTTYCVAVGNKLAALWQQINICKTIAITNKIVYNTVVENQDKEYNIMI